MENSKIVELANQFISNKGYGLTNLCISEEDVNFLVTNIFLSYTTHSRGGLSITIDDVTKETKMNFEEDREYIIYFISKKFVNSFRQTLVDSGISDVEIMSLESGPMKILYYSNDMLSYFIRNPRYS